MLPISNPQLLKEIKVLSSEFQYPNKYQKTEH